MGRPSKLTDKQWGEMACKYCGRTKQDPGHRTCDGCGARVYLICCGEPVTDRAEARRERRMALGLPGGLIFVDDPRLSLVDHRLVVRVK